MERRDPACDEPASPVGNRRRSDTDFRRNFVAWRSRGGGQFDSCSGAQLVRDHSSIGPPPQISAILIVQID
jgi:hypothetical protein